MRILLAIAALPLLAGCDLAERLDGKSPAREHIERMALVTLPEPEPVNLADGIAPVATVAVESVLPVVEPEPVCEPVVCP